MVDYGVQFQTVADVLGIVENAPSAIGTQATGTGTGTRDITVRLLTPRALNVGCSESVAASSRRHASRLLK
jgi:hypothetical protein